MQENLFHMPENAEKRSVGRPRIRISEEKQALIRFAIKGGMSREAVAHALNLDPTTIRKYFSPFFSGGDDTAIKAAARLRKMGSELHRISEELRTSASKDEVQE